MMFKKTKNDNINNNNGIGQRRIATFYHWEQTKPAARNFQNTYHSLVVDLDHLITSMDFLTLVSRRLSTREKNLLYREGVEVEGKSRN